MRSAELMFHMLLGCLLPPCSCREAWTGVSVSKLRDPSVYSHLNLFQDALLCGCFGLSGYGLIKMAKTKGR